MTTFAEEHSDTRSSLAHWYAIARKSRFANSVQLRGTFPHADQVGKFTVFNIGGNKVRLIAALHYNRNKIYIRHVLTHQSTTLKNGRNNVSFAQLQKVAKAWPPISRAVRVPRTEGDYLDLVQLLDRITDEVGECENHPLASLMDVLGVLIEKYEDENVAELTE